MLNCCRMVHTIHSVRTDSFSVWRVQSMDSKEVQGQDPRENTTSHVLSISIQLRQVKLFGLLDDTTSRQTGVSQPNRLDHQRQAIMPPPMAPIRASSSFTDPTFLAQLVKAVVDAMNSASTPTTPAMLINLVVMIPTDNVVILVRIVKSMREMRCEPFLQ